MKTFTRRIVAAAIGIGVLLLAGCAAGPTPLTAASIQNAVATGEIAATNSLEEYRLGGGDQLRVIVYGEEDLSGEFVVDGSGYVALPLVGQVQAGGLTVREFEQQAVADFSRRYLRNPQVAAEVINFRPFYIIGEVTTGGQYPYVQAMTILNAIAVAGGYTYRADRRRIFITRANAPGEIEFVINQGVQVLPGDIIRVPERFF